MWLLSGAERAICAKRGVGAELCRAAVWRIARDVSVRARTWPRRRQAPPPPRRPAPRPHPRPPLLGRRATPAPARPPTTTFAYPRRCNKINFPLKVRVATYRTWTEITFQ